jgi:hypothetical protein
VTHKLLTEELAVRIMRWRPAPDRFLIGTKGWKPRWKFQPTEKLEDAVALLVAASPTKYSMGTGPAGGFWARVKINTAIGEATEKSLAAAITFAVARAARIGFAR